jgi:integrase
MLTDDFIKSLPLPEKRREIADTAVGGLYLIVQRSGAKNWAVSYRFDGARQKMTLGRYPAMDLDTARKRAREALSQVAMGTDPVAARRATKAAANAKRTAQVERGQWLAKPEAKSRGRRETEGTFIKELAARLQGRPLPQIKRVEVHEMLDAILDHGAPIRANRIFAQLMADWAISHGTADRSRTLSKARDRVLSDEEIRLAWNAFDSIGWPFGPIGKLLLLTGASRDEIASGRWSEIDFVTKTWTIAKERSKKSVAREIPLSEAAMRIIEDLPRAEGGEGFVFARSDGTAASSFSRDKAAIDQVMLDVMKRQAEARGGDPDSVRPPAPWTLHHLRRTVAANLQRLGVKAEVAAAVLGDGRRSQGAVAGLYPTHEYVAEKRIALAVWANRLDAIVNGSAAPGINGLAERNCNDSWFPRSRI